jgi:hypothetical protein
LNYSGLDIIEVPPDTLLDGYLSQQNVYSFFQTPAWMDCLTSSFPDYSNATLIFRFTPDTQVLLPLVKVSKMMGLLNTYHSMPFNTYGGFLVQGNLEPNAVDMINRYLQKLRSLRFSITPYPLEISLIEGIKYKSTLVHATQFLDLRTGYENLWNHSFEAKNRNQIRKGESNHLRLFVNSQEASSTYYSLYHYWLMAHQKQARIVYPESLFNALSQYREVAKFMLAEHNGKVISGIIVLYGKKTAMYWNAVNTTKGRELCANQWLLDQAIKDACQLGMEWFDMGASPGMPNLEKFKTAFGTQKIEYKIFWI